MNNNIEILAPAGDFKCLEYAILYGADAIYLGGKTFGMRASSSNFSYTDLKNAVKLAHSKNVKIYLTCNTIPTNEEILNIEDFLLKAQEAEVDGLIIADIGIFIEAKKIIPNMPLHISTQAGIMNYKTANALYELGAKRVVLARELSLKDIEIIRKNTPNDLELEYFVHGAMCISISGRCLLSNYLTGRDANRGNCAQACRWKYCLMEEKRPGEYFPIFEDGEDGKSFILNSKDLCLIEHLNKLLNVGVSSFKIEGRAKSLYYVAVITNAYKIASNILKRSILNGENYVLPNWLKNEVLKISYRHYTTGFLFGKPKDGQYYESGGYVRTYNIVATIVCCEDDKIRCIQKNKFSVGDEIEILSPGEKPNSYKILEMFNEDLNSINSAPHSEMIVYIKISKSKNENNENIVKGSIIRKKIGY